MLLPRLSARRSAIILTTFLLILLYLLATRIPRLTNSYLYDLSYESYFDRQFRVYVMTSSCERFTSDAVAQFPATSLTLVPNTPTTPQCDALDRTQLPLHFDSGQREKLSKDDLFREKYAQALDACAAGNHAKCLILEDDVVFLHAPQRTREVLVEHTLPLFNDGEVDAFDCTKRGWGWLGSTHTGMGSQCRVFSKHAAPCLGRCLRDRYGGDELQLDAGLVRCQVFCGL
ncbi:uncharacterized protein BDV17DRAFT_257645, partial [Aspergillus undulatus]|uniref:uncharacterized protein n=1 Tax=Aspergillus undulatus TaxID=1810928 RepID=UPI003CCDACF2